VPVAAIEPEVAAELEQGAPAPDAAPSKPEASRGAELR